MARRPNPRRLRARRRSCDPARRIAEALGADRDERSRPAASISAASRAARDPAHADHRDRDRGGHRADLGERDRPDRRARRGRRCPPPSQGRPIAGSMALAFSVLISETASAPPSSAATRDRGRVGDVRRQLHDQRLRGQRPQRARAAPRVSAGCSPTISPDWTLGQETLSSIAATSVAAADRLDQPRELARGSSPITETISGTGSSASCGRSSAEEALEALVRQPDRVDHPGRRLPEPRRRVAGARLRRDRLRDEGRERELVEQRVAEGPPRRDRVEGAGAVDDRVARARCRRDRSQVHQWPDPGTSAVAISSPRTTGPSTQRRM